MHKLYTNNTSKIFFLSTIKYTEFKFPSLEFLIVWCVCVCVCMCVWGRYVCVFLNFVWIWIKLKSTCYNYIWLIFFLNFLNFVFLLFPFLFFCQSFTKENGSFVLQNFLHSRLFWLYPLGGVANRCPKLLSFGILRLSSIFESKAQMSSLLYFIRVKCCICYFIQVKSSPQSNFYLTYLSIYLQIF